MLEALGKNLIVERIKEEEKIGSLIINSETKNYHKAVLISKGNKVEIDVNVGDIVLVKPFSGTRIDDNESQFIAINEDYILGKWNDK